MEFLARCGPAFLRRYHQAWIQAPAAIGLAAVDADDEVVGVLLGAVDPAVHVAAMARRHGAALGVRLIVAAAGRPRLARDLVATRARRYARGLWRTLIRPRLVAAPTTGEGPGRLPGIGEITHLLVAPSQQGGGVGRALVTAAVDEARRAGLEELVLVTPPDLQARGFYERLGWAADGEVTSRSGETFVRYRYRLA